MGAAVSTNYLIGLGAIDQRTLILVDIGSLMSSEELGLISKLAT
jgi:purine-binding chemotaxis protein CheW